jgi:hypothetical protein
MLADFPGYCGSGKREHPLAGIPPAMYSARHAGLELFLTLAELEAFPCALLAVFLPLSHA